MQNGYKITAVWKVISPFTVNSTGNSGRFRIKNLSGARIYPTTTTPSYVNVTPVTVTSLPTDPAYPTSYVYELEYTSGFIPQTYFDNGYILENLGVINTECGYKAIEPQSIFGLFIGDVEILPCDRVDKVYINPGIQAIAGSDVGAACYVSGYTHANRHEVQYRPAGTSTWTTITFPIAVPYINYFDAWMVSLPSGNLEFRYRNQMASPACNGPWSDIETYSW
ncbi:MAG: hypothetical protein EOO89_16670 [Pedobacter sp.]|nr:MAG: hypothetical protein EOO89_16670 [Pedobacter sp.]